jgi:hypothetical protein
MPSIQTKPKYKIVSITLPDGSRGNFGGRHNSAISESTAIIEAQGDWVIVTPKNPDETWQARFHGAQVKQITLKRIDEDQVDN